LTATTVLLRCCGSYRFIVSARDLPKPGAKVRIFGSLEGHWIKANPMGSLSCLGGASHKGPAFHPDVEKIIDSCLLGDRIEAGYYKSVGEYAGNDFSKENPYADNLGEIGRSERSGLLRRYILEADERVQAVRERWSQPEGKRPGWGDPGRVLTESDLAVPDAVSDGRTGGVSREPAGLPRFQRAERPGDGATSFVGIHYSTTPGLTAIDPGFAGIGGAGQG